MADNPSKVTMSGGFHKLSKDAEGEVTLQFKIPKSDADKALTMPEGVLLLVTVEVDVNGEKAKAAKVKGEGKGKGRARSRTAPEV